MTRYMLNIGPIEDRQRTKKMQVADILLGEKEEEKQYAGVKTMNWRL